MQKMLVLLWGALVLAASLSPCLADDAVPVAKIDADMKAAIARHQTVGMTIAIVRGGNVVFERAYGERNAAANLPAEITTQYEIGSMTKQFTAAAVMQLVEAGKVSLTAPLATYLPHAPYASQVTIAELLSHTSGIPNYLEGAGIVAAAAHPATFDQIIARIASKPLLFTPGTQYAYSNTNYLLLGRVIEVASGEPYERYLFDRVLAKAPGANFAIIADESRLPDMSTGYESGKPAPPLDNSWAGPAGNLVGTVGDMIAWDAALTSGQVVSPASYAAMTSVQTPPGASMPYGFGLVADRYDGQPRIWHNGGTFGFNTSDQFYPNQQTRILVFTNDAAGGADALAQRIFEDLYPSFVPPPVKEDPALTARARSGLEGLLAGKIDRTLFDAAANANLTDALVAQFAAQMRPLGMPLSYAFEGCSMTSDLRVCKYQVTFPSQRMVLTVGADPDGKFNLFLIRP